MAAGGAEVPRALTTTASHSCFYFYGTDTTFAQVQQIAVVFCLEWFMLSASGRQTVKLDFRIVSTDLSSRFIGWHCLRTVVLVMSALTILCVCVSFPCISPSLQQTKA